MEQLVTYETVSEGYGVIQLNRTHKRNAISLEMADQLMENINLAKEEDIKFLVLTAADQESMFCAGGDLNDLNGELPNSEAEKRLQRMFPVLEGIVKFPVPVIALLNGNALGGGCELATACDIRIAKENTTFGFVQSNIGILPGWGGGAILYKKVDASFALDWVARGNRYDTSFLLEKEWLQAVISEEQWTNRDEVLKEYLNKSIQQMQILKKQFKDQLNVDSLSEQMRMEVKNTAQLWDTPEHKAAVLKFFNRQIK